MTSKSISREECLALAHRVSGGDRSYVDWVRRDEGDKTFDRHIDNPHALAKGLAHQMEAAGAVSVRPLPDGEFGDRLASITKPYVGRLHHLVEPFEVWLASSPHYVRDDIAGNGNGSKVFEYHALVEYLATRFVREMGAIRREEIEQIGLALVDADAAHRANGSDGTGMKNLTRGRRKTPKTAYKAPAEVRSKPGPDGARAVLAAARKAIGGPQLGEQKQAHRTRLSNWIKDNGGTPPSDPKTFRKHGH
jgi:hypothetical protein